MQWAAFKPTGNGAKAASASGFADAQGQPKSKKKSCRIAADAPSQRASIAWSSAGAIEFRCYHPAEDGPAENGCMPWIRNTWRAVLPRWGDKAVRIVGWLPAILVLSFLVLWSVSRAAYPTKSQRDALAQMQARQPPVFEGQNVFALLWLLPYDIPQSEWARVIEQDKRAFEIFRKQKWRELSEADFSGESFFRSSAHGRYPWRFSEADNNVLCQYGEDCLKKVSMDLPAYEALLSRHSTWMEGVGPLSRYGHYDDLFGNGFWSPMSYPSSFDYFRLLSTRAAYDFVNGRHVAAVEALCGNIFWYRKIAANNRSLLYTLLFSTIASRDAELLGEMLARFPVDAHLPAACLAISTAPPQISAADYCAALRSEYEVQSDVINNLPVFSRPGKKRWVISALDRFLYERRQTEAAVAEVFGYYCGREFANAFDEWDSTGTMRADVDIGRLECFGNLMGCMHRSVNMGRNGSYRRYAQRAADMNARMRLLGMILRSRAIYEKEGHFSLGKAVNEYCLSKAYDLDGIYWQIEKKSGRAELKLIVGSDADESWGLPLPNGVSGESVSGDRAGRIRKDDNDGYMTESIRLHQFTHIDCEKAAPAATR
ncbi:MAG: hypothetical protein E6Q88_06980 [Lysobacteraceae bacterium]|nr:MAG: hypothetical protein E6Q88_06980 [Xanthomonadaceae bacterium]